MGKYIDRLVARPELDCNTLWTTVIQCLTAIFPVLLTASSHSKPLCKAGGVGVNGTSGALIFVAT